MNRRADAEAGQLTPMILGLVAILVMAVVVVVNASHAFLERRALVSWADGAATVAVQEIDLAALYTGEPTSTLPLSEERARQAVRSYLARNDAAAGFEQFRLDRVTVGGDGSVTVQLAARIPIVLDAGLTTGFGDGVPITVSASAVATLR